MNKRGIHDNRYGRPNCTYCHELAKRPRHEINLTPEDYFVQADGDVRIDNASLKEKSNTGDEYEKVCAKIALAERDERVREDYWDMITKEIRKGTGALDYRVVSAYIWEHRIMGEALDRLLFMFYTKCPKYQLQESVNDKDVCTLMSKLQKMGIGHLPMSGLITDNFFYSQWMLLPKGSTIKKSILCMQYNMEDIESDGFPPMLEKLRTGIEFNRPIPHGWISHLDQLTELTLGYGFNQAIEPGSLPTNLRKLQFERFNQPLLSGVLPENLRELEFGCDFNQPIDIDVLPQKLEKLTFGFNFNQPIDKDVLPKNLRELEFGGGYNQPLEEVLPDGLQKLRFGWSFNQDVTLPTSLKELYFGKSFDSTWNWKQLTSLRYLTLQKKIDHAEDLMKSLKSLRSLRIGRETYKLSGWEYEPECILD